MSRRIPRRSAKGKNAWKLKRDYKKTQQLYREAGTTGLAFGRVWNAQKGTMK